ncbi:hypothetical protein SAMN05444158_3322 [Bradyrhizobium canariense]|uniref:Uncharacterized protein n=1 Tax=Bradyrhizobium canariense TaxID=255045 RepID=A0A1H1VAQ2_9BRAD|nr:hypothetical protein SAMN05444158_3322 [Bradyrhizobium canariense]
MIQIVLHRNLSLVIACSDGMRWVRGDTSHGWQDKSRKVRRVGRLGIASKFNHTGNIAKTRHNLPFLLARCSSSVFDTLGRIR